MKNFLLCLFVVMGGVMNANTIKKCVAGPTAISFTVVNSTCGLANGSVTLGTVTGGAAPYTYSFNGSAYTGTTNYSGLLAGTYSLTVQDSNAATYSTSVTITDSPGPTAVATTVVDAACGSSNGSVTLGAVTGGTAPYIYSFDGGAYNTATVYTGLLAGSYPIDVKDVNGCIFSTIVSINNNGGPTAVATTVVNASCGASDGSVTFGAVTGGTNPYQFNFNNLGYSGTTNYTNLSVGTYSIDVKDANGCVYTTSVVVSNSGGPTAIASTIVDSTCGNPDGSVTLGTVTGGTPAYLYSFNGSVYTSTTSYTNLLAGTYTLEVKDANGCIYSTSVIVGNSGAVTTPTISSVTQPTCAVPSGTIIVNAQSGAEYSIDNGAIYQASTTFSGLAPGSYTIRVRNVANPACFADNPNLTTINAVPTAPTAPTPSSVTQPSCGMSTGTIVFNSQAGVQYSVNNGAIYQASAAFSGLAPGTYTLVVRNTADGTCSATAASTVTINATSGGPTSVATTINTATCGASDGSFTIDSVAGGVAPYTYNFNNLGFSGTTAYSGLASGSYSLDVKDANGCTFSTFISISNTGGPTGLSAFTVNSSCGAADGSVTLGSVTGGTAPYVYSFNAGGYNPTTVYSGLSAGTYGLSVKDANGCIFSTNVVIIDNPGPTGVATTVVNSSCGAADGSVSIGAVTGGTPVYTYSFNGSAYTSSTLNYSGLSAGSYTLNVKDTNGCIFTTSVTIIDNPGPTNIANTVVNASCGASDGSITLGAVTGGTAPYTYQFNGSGYTNTTSYTGLVAGSYSIAVKDANGCIYTTSVVISNSGGPTAIASTIINSTCGNADGSVTLGAVTGGTPAYTYSFNGSAYTTTTNYSALIAGSYSLDVKDANGCIYSTSVVVGNSGAVTTPTTASITQPTCAVPTGTIVINAQSGVEYSIDNGSSYQASTTFSGLAPGSYTLRVRNIANTACFADNPNLITINAVPNAPTQPTVASVTQPNCGVTSGTIVFTTQAGVQYSVNSGVTYQASATFSGLAPGTYTLVVKNTADGTCSATAASTVTINSTTGGPTSVATTITTATCGASDGSFTIDSVTGGVAPYTYNFNNLGFTSTTAYSGLAAGSYPLDVKDANGCIFSTFISVNNTGGPTGLSTTTVNSSCGAADGSVNIGTVTGGTAPYVYSFNGNPFISTTSYSGLLAGTYPVSVKDANGCIYATSVSIIDNPGPTAVATTVVNASGGNADGSVTFGAVTGGNAPYTYSLNGTGFSSTTSYTGLIAGTYTIAVKDANGCAFTTTVTITSTGTSYTDLAVYIYPNGGPRPGFTYSNTVYIYNNGNQTTPAGTLTFTKDSRVTITNVSPSATMNGTGFTYNYPSLAPYQTLYVYVTMQVPPIPTVNIGDLLTNSVSIDIPAGDINTANNIASSTQDVRGAYDPNDKSEAHGPKIVHSTFTSADFLSYTIQFENTGNADAINIRVNDMLESKLDETTIKTIDASHAYVLSQTGSDLDWNFNNINLPAGGKGYINFQIKPKAGYVVGDIITNSASIYFDFNPAIVTNPFATEFVTTLGVAGFVNNQFSAYPNPTTGIITITLKNSAAIINTITVTDVLGKTVKTNSVNNANTTVDLSHLSKGLYFVKIQAEGQVNTLKVIKE